MRVFENLLKRQQPLTNQTSGPMENYTGAVKNSTGALESRGEGPTMQTMAKDQAGSLRYVPLVVGYGETSFEIIVISQVIL